MIRRQDWTDIRAERSTHRLLDKQAEQDRSTDAMQDVAGFVDGLLETWHAGQDPEAFVWREDGACPPRCVVHQFLACWKLKDELKAIWADVDLSVTWSRELQLLTEWFAVGMASTVDAKARFHYRAFHRRVKLQREDMYRPVVSKKSAFKNTRAWRAAVDLQTRPVIVEALVAAHDLKQTLVEQFGPAATSLGTVAVERSWWQHLLRNINKSGVWARNSWRQYHAVVGWKKDVLSILRKLVCSIGRTDSRKCRALLEQSLDDLRHALQVGERPALRLLPGQCSAVEPVDDEMNAGYDSFRKNIDF